MVEFDIVVYVILKQWHSGILKIWFLQIFGQIKVTSRTEGSTKTNSGKFV